MCARIFDVQLSTAKTALCNCVNTKVCYLIDSWYSLSEHSFKHVWFSMSEVYHAQKYILYIRDEFYSTACLSSAFFTITILVNKRIKYLYNLAWRVKFMWRLINRNSSLLRRITNWGLAPKYKFSAVCFSKVLSQPYIKISRLKIHLYIYQDHMYMDDVIVIWTISERSCSDKVYITIHYTTWLLPALYSKLYLENDLMPIT